MISLKNEAIQVLIDPVGSKLKSIQSIPEGLEYLWQKSTFPNLFPFVGRLFEKSYTLHGKTYPMEIHGFSGNIRMDVIQQDDHSCTLQLTDTPETKARYPYSFCFRVAYCLVGNRIEIAYQAQNRSDEPMYCAFGGHPGFRIPLEDGLTFEDYALTFPKACQPEQIQFSGSILTLDERIPYPLVDNIRLPLSHSLFRHDAVVLSGTPGSVTLSSRKGQHGVQVSYPQMPYVGFWQYDKGEPPFLCIEPWSTLPGRDGVLEELSQFPDMTCIHPGECFQNSWSITVW